MLPDLHIHTARCGHAHGEMAAYVEAARRRGVTHLGFADHIPMYWLPSSRRDPALAMGEDDLPVYVENVLALRRENPDLTISLGIEADYIPGYEDRLRAILSAYPFDYVLGSVHYLDGWGFDHPDQVEEYARRDIDEIYRQYFLAMQEAARSGLFDVMAHPDLIKKFGHRPRMELEDLYDQTARVLAGAGVCVEVNTAGLRKPVREIYPALEFLKCCYHCGVPATPGSDAHHPDQVAFGWAEAKKWLAAAGYRQVALFAKRSRQFVPIR
ncbi:MAG: histidinol-phosphatase HisJ family protein [Thermoanaerobacteraceae bacterium]|nr:histidinol-phosphatase HisJ family protein [Thermoanaerobacteraceae bacterium]